MKAVLITATDTSAGKTVVCGLLARYLLNKDYRVVTQKWIQTGTTDPPTDIAAHLELMGKTNADIKNYLTDMTPYTFKLPASPHLAAALEKRKINAEKIKNSFQRLSCNFDFVIVEGTGGALVPFNKKSLVIDIAKELNLPAIIVVKNKLGAINHTLLTIEAIKSRGMKILGIIFNNQFEEKNKAILVDNPKIIRKLSGEKTLGTLPWQNNPNLLHRAFVPIGNELFDQITRKQTSG